MARGVNGAAAPAGVADMHEVMFRLKRAHLRAVEFAKPLAQAFGLTPARFDVLYAIQIAGHAGTREVSQKVIRNALGLSAATISKILARMEKRGLVTRARSFVDRRRSEVVITSYGLAAFGAAVHAFLRLGILQGVYETIYGGGDAAQSKGFLTRMRNGLRKVARRFGDRSSIAYPTRVPTPRRAEVALEADIRQFRFRARCECLRAEHARLRAVERECQRQRRLRESFFEDPSDPLFWPDIHKPEPDPPRIHDWHRQRIHSIVRRRRVARARLAKIILDPRPLPLMLPPGPTASPVESGTSAPTTPANECSAANMTAAQAHEPAHAPPTGTPAHAPAHDGK